jgi:hypothetical protein
MVGKELEDIERRHCDMTSILHALGISVEGGEVCAVLMDTLNPSLADCKKTICC